MDENNRNKKYYREDFVDKKSYSEKSSKSRSKKRRASGRGIVKYRKNLRHPYTAMVCVGKYVDGNNKIQCRYKSLGSFSLKGEAEKALSEFYRAPYDLDPKVKTFSDLYEEWFKDYKTKLKSESSIRTIESTYKYCNGLYNMNIQKIGPGHIKDAMYHGYIYEERGKNKGCRKYASDGTKERIKSLCNMMFDYATERKLLNHNPARAFKITDLLEKIEMNKKKKIPFNNNDVKLLWENEKYIFGIDMILVGIYTGFRPSELCLLEVKNIHLEEGYVIGGMKTASGTNRIVPIHPLIRAFIEKRYDEAINEYDGKYLFNTTSLRGKHNITYDVYRHMFSDIMEELGLEGYSPHCTRHTFASQAEVCNMRTRAIKLILGHSQKRDVTNSVYTHTDIGYLKKELSKYRFKGDDDYE